MSSCIEKERLFQRLCATKCLLRKSLAAGALCRHTSDVLLRFPEASLLEEIHRQGLFFPRRKHPCSEKSPVRDYFPEAKASLLREIPRQGLFSRGESIPVRRNPPPGIIFPRQMHPCSEKSLFKDYFPEAKASLLREISRQGLFSRGGCIPARGNLPSRIIFPRLTLCPQSYTDLSRTRRTQANVYQSYLIRWRAASFASSAAPEAGTVIPSCAPHYGRNLPVFFPKRG